jgi:hypothetical protein
MIVEINIFITEENYSLADLWDDDVCKICVSDIGQGLILDRNYDFDDQGSYIYFLVVANS